MFCAAPRHRAGFSLIELNLVVATIAVLALMSVPAREPATQLQADNDAVRVAGAVRYARDLALHQQVPHGLQIDTDNRRLRLYRIDRDLGGPVFDVLDPVRRATFELTLSRSQRAMFSWAGLPPLDGQAPSVLETVTNDGLGLCNARDALQFDVQGVPRCADNVGDRLTDVTVAVGSTRYRVELAIDPYTGRVVQQ